MQSRKLKRELIKQVKYIEKTKGDYISYILSENFDGNEHNMVVDGKVFDFVQKQTEQELLPLEKADLTDYWNLGENGRTNKKRRNLLC